MYLMMTDDMFLCEFSVHSHCQNLGIRVAGSRQPNGLGVGDKMCITMCRHKECAMSWVKNEGRPMEVFIPEKL